MRFAVTAAILSGILFVLGGAMAQGAARPVLLVVGDSLSAAYKIPVAEGWVHLLGERLVAEGYDYRVVNASIPGDTSAGGLARLPAALARYRPKIVVIELGGNDGLQGLPLDQMRANLAHMVKLAQTADANVLLVGVRMPPNYGPVYAGRFQAVYKEVASQSGAALAPELLAGVATHPGLMQSDGLHPRAAAEPKLLDNIWPALEPLLAAGSAAATRPARRSPPPGRPGPRGLHAEGSSRAPFHRPFGTRQHEQVRAVVPVGILHRDFGI